MLLPLLPSPGKGMDEAGLPGILGGSCAGMEQWQGGEAGDMGQRLEFIVPITQAGIFKAALGTRMRNSHSFLLGIPNPPGCFENPSLTSRVTGRSQTPLHLCHADNPTTAAVALTQGPSLKLQPDLSVECVQLSHCRRDLPAWTAKGT